MAIVIFVEAHPERAAHDAVTEENRGTKEDPERWQPIETGTSCLRPNKQGNYE
jgi:hypothetical protein